VASAKSSGVDGSSTSNSATAASSSVANDKSESLQCPQSGDESTAASDGTAGGSLQSHLKRFAALYHAYVQTPTTTSSTKAAEASVSTTPSIADDAIADKATKIDTYTNAQSDQYSDSKEASHSQQPQTSVLTTEAHTEQSLSTNSNSSSNTGNNDSSAILRSLSISNFQSLASNYAVSASTTLSGQLLGAAFSGSYLSGAGTMKKIASPIGQELREMSFNDHCAVHNSSPINSPTSPTTPFHSPFRMSFEIARRGPFSPRGMFSPRKRFVLNAEHGMPHQSTTYHMQERLQIRRSVSVDTFADILAEIDASSNGVDIDGEQRSDVLTIAHIDHTNFNYSPIFAGMTFSEGSIRKGYDADTSRKSGLQLPVHNDAHDTTTPATVTMNLLPRLPCTDSEWPLKQSDQSPSALNDATTSTIRCSRIQRRSNSRVCDSYGDIHFYGDGELLASEPVDLTAARCKSQKNLSIRATTATVTTADADTSVREGVAIETPGIDSQGLVTDNREATVAECSVASAEDHIALPSDLLQGQYRYPITAYVAHGVSLMTCNPSISALRQRLADIVAATENDSGEEDEEEYVTCTDSGGADTGTAPPNRSRSMDNSTVGGIPTSVNDSGCAVIQVDDGDARESATDFNVDVVMEALGLHSIVALLLAGNEPATVSSQLP
jgi:hypothetical protein